jgi:hypothetical protein
MLLNQDALELPGRVLSGAIMLSARRADYMILCILASAGLALTPLGANAAASGVAAIYQESNPSPQKHCEKSPRAAILAPKPAGTAQDAPAPEAEDNSPCPAVSPDAAPDAGFVAPAPRRDDLVEIVVAQPVTVRLAEGSEIPLRLHEKGLTTVETLQTQYYGLNDVARSDVHGSDMELPVDYKADGSTVIHVIPLRIGKLELSISGRFTNGPIFHKKVTLNVEPPSILPKSLTVSDGKIPSGIERIKLYVEGQPGRSWMQVRALFDTFKDPILIDPTAVTFNIRTNDPTPPMHLDETTGLFTPLHVGHALIESHFGQLTALTCVVVEAKFGFGGANYDRSRCEELLQPGEKLTAPLGVHRE